MAPANPGLTMTITAKPDCPATKRKYQPGSIIHIPETVDTLMVTRNSYNILPPTDKFPYIITVIMSLARQITELTTSNKLPVYPDTVIGLTSNRKLTSATAFCSRQLKGPAKIYKIIIFKWTLCNPYPFTLIDVH
jgi:hypothetical protein